MKETLLIRADASFYIGAGHVMRCLALAQAWLDRGGYCVFVMVTDAGSLFSRLEAEGIEVRRITVEAGSGADARETLLILKETGASHLVLDGYHFSAGYQQIIWQSTRCESHTPKVLVVDDNCEQTHYYADFILNQNIQAREELYPISKRETNTTLLLGLNYCLLRREFLQLKEFKREISPKAHKILVTLGGSDPYNVTAAILGTIKLLKDESLCIKVVLGGNNPHFDAINQLSQTLPGKTEIIRNAQDISELMIWADLAVSAAGSTVWEMCLLGLPCFLVVTADNQEGLAKRMQDCELSFGVYHTNELGHLGDAIRSCLDDQARREDCSRRMQETVCGGGVRNVLRQLLCGEIQLRLAQESDAKMVWAWANDPDTRLRSFTSALISWENHLAWYTRKLALPNARIYIALTQSGDGCGLIRFDIQNGTAVVGITVAPEYRGIGLAAEIISRGTHAFRVEQSPMRIEAFIKPDNQASRQAFDLCGYKFTENTTFDGQACEKFCYEP